MINDLSLTDTDLWKYIDTTASETVNKSQKSGEQVIADEMLQWSQNNKMKLNEAKCKELCISFSTVPRDFSPIINDKCVKAVESCKLLGMTINNK